MIIYPQINNLRIIVIPFVVVLSVLSYYSYKSYHSIQEYETFLVQENKNVATELFDMIFAYHDIEVENEGLLNRLAASKNRISKVLDSVQTYEPSTQLILSYRKQLRELKEENKRILELVEELNEENEFLKVQADYVGQELEHSKERVTKFEKKNSQLSKKNIGLKAKLEDVSKLKEKLKDASKPIISSISINAVKRIKSDNIIVETKKAKRTKKIHACFTIQENKVAAKGVQNYYIQIIDPSNNVVGDRGTVSIDGVSTLIYSKMVTVQYDNKALNVCEFIEPSSGEKFEKGHYFVSIFNNYGIVEETFFLLK
ncbi:hypothetical protein [uncultured Lacinutrix sp.]|uniref:hypothetical protein n=1 Tax=uncultured Lacinutrix sp. TaxID=574032 RepID=UPI002617B539|nr:hypothetical protein [uncultured Lacinutrix sp.]